MKKLSAVFKPQLFYQLLERMGNFASLLIKMMQDYLKNLGVSLFQCSPFQQKVKVFVTFQVLLRLDLWGII